MPPCCEKRPLLSQPTQTWEARNASHANAGRIGKLLKTNNFSKAERTTRRACPSSTMRKVFRNLCKIYSRPRTVRQGEDVD
jgi:hypothetical protein